MAGLKFERLRVLSRAGRVFRRATWNCVCDCGNACIVRGEYLRNGTTKSCGCLRIHSGRINGHLTATHGQTKTTEYRAWSRAKSRCYNPKFPNFQYYGGRGITVSDEWRNSFESFYGDFHAGGSAAVDAAEARS